MTADFADIVKAFRVEGILDSVTPCGSGHVNDTYIVACRQNGQHRRYTLQRINHSIFTHPQQLMDNVLRVTQHIRHKLQQEQAADIERRVLTVIPTHSGGSCCQDCHGCYWRMYQYIDEAQSRDYLSSPDMAFEAARMFGRFQRLLDLPEPKLAETIPDFHNTPKRLADFIRALESDSHNRAAEAKEEIRFVLDHAGMCDHLLRQVRQGLIPERITHNDTKISNVLFDSRTGQGICVIDLDTVMPGLSLYDFGDMVRTAACPAAEDEENLSKIRLERTFFAALVRGYISQTADFLTPAEKQHLVFAGKLITFEQMIRFLGDYLNGDSYYKISRPGHNLIRARTQMKLVQSIQEQEEALHACVNSLLETVQ